MKNELARYRVSSRSYRYMGCESFVGRVHYYQPWDDKKEHDSEYRGFYFSESTGIHRTCPQDAQYDAYLLGRELTGHDMPDNIKDINEIRL